MTFQKYIEENNVRFAPEQEEAVNCIDNCVVSAGAGSGKTMVLSYRFLKLVMENNVHVDQILTMTFTKKATSEMKGRIHKRLMDAGLSEELRRFPNATISTVDSFCSSIARLGCAEYGISPQFSIADEDESRDNARRIARKLFEQSLDRISTARLIKYYNPDSLIEMFVQLSDKMLDIVHPLNPEESARKFIEFRNQVKRDLKEAFDGSCQDYIDFADFDPKFLKVADKVKTMREAVANDRLDLAQQVRLTKNTGRGNQNKELSDRIIDNINSTLKRLELLYDKNDTPEYARDFYCLISEYAQLLFSSKRSSGKLSFNDVMQLAIDILLRRKDIRQRFKEKYRFIMIDEFQDNNDDYRKLIFLLSEKNGILGDHIPEAHELESQKIFLVGDEKQSIYRFRGADVSVFKRLSKEISATGGRVIELSRNFRSEPELLGCINSVFENVFPEKGPDYEASFQSLVPRQSKGVKTRFEFWNFLHETKYKDSCDFECAPAAACEAEFIACRILDMVSGDDYLIPKEVEYTDENGSICRRTELVRPSYDDIAILERSMGNQNHYEKALRLKNIPYTVEETKALPSEALFNDFYSILQVCIYPYDSLSYVSYLRSPFCNVPDSVISTIDFTLEPFSLPNSELLIAQNNINRLKQVLGEGSLAKTMLFLWNDLGYRNYIISNPSNQVFTEHFDFMYALCADFDSLGKNIVELLQYMEERILDGTRKFRSVNVLHEQSAGVRIMTIHKSKGLEFPIVIVADMGHRGTDHTNDFPFSQDKEGNLYIPSAVKKDGKHLGNIHIEYLRKNEVAMENAETRRLFYVAATRAEDHLVFSGAFSDSVIKTSEEDEKSLSMATMLLDATCFSFESQLANEDVCKAPLVGRTFCAMPIEVTMSKGRLTKSRIGICRRWYRNAGPDDDFNYESGHVAVTSQTEKSTGHSAGGEKLPALECDGILQENNLSADFGTLTHSCIEHLIKADSSEPDMSAFDSLPEFQKTLVLQCAKDLADGFILSDIYDEVRNLVLQTEKPFMVYDGQNILDGKIDLLCMEEGRAVVLDFKTDSIRDEETHRYQLETYAKAVKSIYPECSVDAYVVYLRDMSTVKLV